jgi:hypothetical protein
VHSPAQGRELTLYVRLGNTREISLKYSIPLPEYLDDIQFTRRLDDRRVIAESMRK